jgi:Holliday junction resolvase RusA-like endonuclease
MSKTRLTLTALPPSVNAIWRHTRGGKMYRTSQYMGFLRAEEWNLVPQLKGQHKFTGPVFLTIAMKRPRANSDLDNRAKGLLDLLQHVQAIDNDKNVMGLNLYWSSDLPAGVAAEITIVQADALEKAA